MVTRKTCTAAAIVMALSLSTTVKATAATDLSNKAHIFDSAKHTRIYFPQGADSFADEVVEYKVGKKKPPHLWEAPDAALGTPNFKDYEGDRLARKPSFAGLGAGGSITLRFVDNAIIDGPGADLYIFEPLENSSAVKVEVSRDGQTWIDLGPDLFTASEIDIAEKGGKNATYNFVRITDLSTNVDPSDQWPGADIDAVGALNSAAKISILDHSLCPAGTPNKRHHAETKEEPAKDHIAEELKKVADKFSETNPSKLIVEIFSDSHGSDDKGHPSSPDGTTTGPTPDTKNPQAKTRSSSVNTYLTETAKIPKEKITLEFFDNARSMARRDVEKEHERDNRFDFVFVPYDRNTIIGDKTSLRIDHASALIDGKWDSEQGEVIIITHKEPPSKNVLVSGEWHESPSRRGIIQSGTYNPKTQMLTLSFYRTWSNLKGTADFKLSFDSARLKGKWKGDVGGSGEWTLIRKN